MLEGIQTDVPLFTMVS